MSKKNDKSSNDDIDSDYLKYLNDESPISCFGESINPDFRKQNYIPDAYNLVSTNIITDVDKSKDNLNNDDISKCIIKLIASNTDLNFKLIEEYSDKHFDYIITCINNYLNLTPDDYYSCIRDINDEKKMCNGKFIKIFDEYINKKYSEFNNIIKKNKDIDQSIFDKNKNKLISIYNNNIKLLFKKTIDISKFFDNNICNNISDFTKLSELTYNSLQSDIKKENNNTFNIFSIINNTTIHEIISIIIILFLLYKLYLLLFS